ncbi:hypothetical protein Pla52o_29010 [Novipirellula galeiformis]|uniref:Uncharacterized protein n=1 Tax=Novipirellula galeiformis TaxID=2528004 RepID=A0A5C6CH63_9BACT|nr:hypothetical protein Pla52o_29010 [Novipirellula galeiformis]
MALGFLFHRFVFPYVLKRIVGFGKVLYARAARFGIPNLEWQLQRRCPMHGSRMMLR